MMKYTLIIFSFFSSLVLLLSCVCVFFSHLLVRLRSFSRSLCLVFIFLLNDRLYACKKKIKVKKELLEYKQMFKTNSVHISYVLSVLELRKKKRRKRRRKKTREREKSY